MFQCSNNNNTTTTYLTYLLTYTYILYTTGTLTGTRWNTVQSYALIRPDGFRPVSHHPPDDFPPCRRIESDWRRRPAGRWKPRQSTKSAPPAMRSRRVVSLIARVVPVRSWWRLEGRRLFMLDRGSVDRLPEHFLGDVVPRNQNRPLA